MEWTKENINELVNSQREFFNKVFHLMVLVIQEWVHIMVNGAFENLLILKVY